MLQSKRYSLPPFWILSGAMVLGLMLASTAFAQPSGLADAEAHKRCLELTAGGAGTSDKPTGSRIERAFREFGLEVLIDGIASCRAATAASPQDKNLSAGAIQATKLFKLLIIGTGNANKSENEIFAMLAADALKLKKPNAGTPMVTMVGFYLGSAYEYGKGTEVNKAKAIEWYEVAANAGSKIAARELKRIRSLADPAK